MIRCSEKITSSGVTVLPLWNSMPLRSVTIHEAALPLPGSLDSGTRSLVVLKSGVTREHRLIVSELIALVRERIGPVASFKQSVVVKRLPKTRSGKIVRGTIKKIAEGQPYNVPATIDDPTTLDEISAALAPRLSS